MKNELLNAVKVFCCAGLVGSVFAYFKLPVPAPSDYKGLIGIAGLMVGYAVVIWGRG